MKGEDTGAGVDLGGFTEFHARRSGEEGSNRKSRRRLAIVGLGHC